MNHPKAISSGDLKASEKSHTTSALKAVVTRTEDSNISESEMSPWRTAISRMEPSWHKALEAEFKKPYFNRLLNFLESEQKSSKTVYPPIKSVFRAFELCPLDNVRVVCIGQDPYHGSGQANGLAFSVARGVQIPPLLKEYN